MVSRAIEASSTGCCNQRRTPRARTRPLLPSHVLRCTPACLAAAAAAAALLFVQVHVCVLHSAEAFAVVPRIHQVSAPVQSLCLGNACHYHLTAQQHKLVVPDRRITPAEGTTPPTHLYASKDSEDDLNFDNKYDENDDTDGDDDEDEVEIQPYGNRSLSWTKRYRRLNPYEKCRARVLRFGHRSKEDWDEAAASGQLGQYVPNRPDEMYAPEWVSWEEFLGLMRSYDETRNLAVNVLGLKSFDDYILFVRGNPKRAEGLRIPVRPDLFYKEEWVDEDTFFSRDKYYGVKGGGLWVF